MNPVCLVFGSGATRGGSIPERNIGPDSGCPPSLDRGDGVVPSQRSLAAVFLEHVATPSWKLDPPWRDGGKLRAERHSRTRAGRGGGAPGQRCDVLPRAHGGAASMLELRAVLTNCY